MQIRIPLEVWDISSGKKICVLNIKVHMDKTVQKISVFTVENSVQNSFIFAHANLSNHSRLYSLNLFQLRVQFYCKISISMFDFLYSIENFREQSERFKVIAFVALRSVRDNMNHF